MEAKKIINGYEIMKKLGKGGCGIVYLAKKGNKYYALKRIFELTNEEINQLKKY